MLRLRFVSFALLSSFAFAPACDKPAAPVLTVAVAAPPAPPSNGATPASLGDLLVDEAAHRPTGTPRAEDVLAAFAAGGVTVADARQVVARTVHASYCQGGVTAKNTLVAVCEYPSHDAAVAGRAHSLAAFAKLSPDREILVNGATTLTVAPAGAADEAAQLGQLFGKL
jgi:hypothetical protein